MAPSAAQNGAERLLYEQAHALPRWLFLLLAVSSVTPCAIIGAMALGGKMPMHVGAMVLGLILVIDGALAAWLWTLRLRLVITDAALYIAVRPFINARVARADIAEARIAPAPSSVGASWAPVRGWTINHGATHALTLRTRSDRRFTVGTDRPDELRAALAELGFTT